ncbi:D-tagatose-bisphosphate aldolase, class II, non-catalytic subunit [Paraglaciecola arctica]|uniref:D-tagatose-bisphosphate aldolase, class II, non-catalytic subunit n=1 Tax=Paraglaciecola arctica TaxID=1128911 RepID=UPI002090FD06|nr:D-tagatose-bisphosphate aldolase, class II, non-catalytic subunit [Paraglaciecola arctica]
MNALLQMVQRHKNGEGNGVYSVCSSHPLVIEASMRHALNNDETLLLEATSNQVNQDGGYTGLVPKDFCALVFSIADKVGLNHSRIILGGDHLGPNCWQDLTAAEAMAKSDVLIAEYIKAGFRKIHLDCSMSCEGDPVPLGDDLVAQRAARLCQIAEHTWQTVGGESPVYIIGTEVPVPGGAHEGLNELHPTSVDAAKQTISIHKEAFFKAGLEDVWPRIIGLVVQPGVEFDLHKVIAFKPDQAVKLSDYIESQPLMIYEAHSTDYQTAEHLAALVKGHFAILKVGPWLSFALREACWALDMIEQEWIDKADCSNLKQTLLQAMQDNPVYWKKYYSDEPKAQALDCQYSLSDRIRYYWPQPEVEASLTKLIDNLDNSPAPLTLISQYMPTQYQAIVDGELERDTRGIIFHKISEVLAQYSAACYTSQTA